MQPVLRAESVPEQQSCQAFRQSEISIPPNDGAAYPPPCTPHPYLHHRAVRALDSGKLSCQKLGGNPPLTRILKRACWQVNAAPCAGSFGGAKTNFAAGF